VDYRWKLVAFLFCCGALNYADRATTSTVLPLLRDDLGLSSAGMGAVGSMFLWSYALGSPVAGMLADRFSRRWIIAGSLAAWSFVTLVTGFVTSVNELLAARFFLGISECCYLPASLALIADYHEGETRARSINFHTAGLSVGVVAGGYISGYLGERYGWRVPFWVLGGLGLILAAVAAGFLRDVPRDRLHPSSSAAVPVLAEVANLARVPTYLLVVGSEVVVSVGTWIFINWLPLYFNETHSQNLAAAGFWGTFLLQFPAVLGTALGGVISDRAAQVHKRRRMLVETVCYVAAAPLLWCFVTRLPVSTIAVLIFLFGLLSAIGAANDVPMICDLLLPHQRSTALGFMNAMNCTAAGLGVFLTGLLKDRYGLSTIFASCAWLTFLAAGLVFVSYRFFAARDLARREQQAVAAEFQTSA
jgi:predicted MFS family arabinose efflux permease